MVCKHKCSSFVFDLLFQCFDTDLTQRKRAKQFSAQKVTFSWRLVIVILYLAFEECNWLTVVWRLNRTTSRWLTESFCCNLQNRRTKIEQQKIEQQPADWQSLSAATCKKMKNLRSKIKQQQFDWQLTFSWNKVPVFIFSVYFLAPQGVGWGVGGGGKT